MRRPSVFTLQQLGAAAFLGFAVGCAVVTITDRSAASGAQGGITIVDRTHKGDRLPLASPPQPHSSSLLPSVIGPSKRTPLGCDPAFSQLAEPGSARVYLRCLS